MKIDALSGQFSDGNPILNVLQDYSGVVTLARKAKWVEVASELTQSQSRAVSGTAGPQRRFLGDEQQYR